MKDERDEAKRKISNLTTKRDNLKQEEEMLKIAIETKKKAKEDAIK